MSDNEAGTEPPLIEIRRMNLFTSGGSLEPFQWNYEAVGPDDVEFTLVSLEDLERLLRERYGQDAELVKAWDDDAPL